MASKKNKKIIVSGIDELRQRYEDEERASGRTPEQTKAMKLLDMHLYSAAGRVAPIPPLFGSPTAWKGQRRGRNWENWMQAERGRRWLRMKVRKVTDEEKADVFAVMYFALGILMENASLDDHADRITPRDEGPSVDELCNSCRHRIERRYLPPMHPSESPRKASTIRLYFPVGQRRRLRAEEVRAAWRIARRHRLFPSKGRFAQHASELVHLTPRWILKCIEGQV